MVVAALLSACGAGGDASTAPEQPDDVARLQPGDRPVRFRLDTAVTPEHERFIVETLGWAHSDHGDSGPLTIHVYSDQERFVTAYTNDFGIDRAQARDQLAKGQTAFASYGGHIWIYLLNYEKRPENQRRHALFHEYLHTLQQWLAEVRFQSKTPAERSFVPRWLVEGCAEYLAVRAGAGRGFIDESRQRAIVVDRARRGTDPLSAFETKGEAGFQGGTGEAYTVGWLGCERLALTRGPDAVTRQFWVSMAATRDWELAFTDAFGVTPAAFYADFDLYRATL